VDRAAGGERHRRGGARRLRAGGARQFLPPADGLADFFETDPYSPPVVRDPISRDVEVVVIGGGFAGLITAARLKQAGITDLRILEMGGDFGGGWYWNRHPRLQCGNESHTYHPLLPKPNHLPSTPFTDRSA